MCHVTLDALPVQCQQRSMLDHKRIKSKKLQRLAKTGDDSKIRAEWRRKVRRILAALDIMVSPDELNLPGMKWHKLTGNREGTYSVLVSGNWRITYRWDHQGSYDVMLEDYHG